MGRYRNLIYGFGLATDVLVRGAKDKALDLPPVPGAHPTTTPATRAGEMRRPSGLILPTRTVAPRG